MNKKICDRCGEEIEGTTYYTVNIYGHDINPTNDTRVCMDTAIQNLSEGMKKVNNPERCYCKHCKSEIEMYIYRPVCTQPKYLESFWGIELSWWQKMWLKISRTKL